LFRLLTFASVKCQIFLLTREISSGIVFFRRFLATLSLRCFSWSRLVERSFCVLPLIVLLWILSVQRSPGYLFGGALFPTYLFSSVFGNFAFFGAVFSGLSSFAFIVRAGRLVPASFLAFLALEFVMGGFIFSARRTLPLWPRRQSFAFLVGIVILESNL